MFCANDVHRPLHVVRQHVQAHLGTYPIKRFCEEVRRAHPGFQGAERVLHSGASNAHRIRVLICIQI